MQTNQENVNTSSGVPVQMVTPQLSVQAQTVQSQNINSQRSAPYSTMMYPTISMAQSPLQQQMQTIQQNINTNSEAPVQMVLPEVNAQEQTAQSGNIPQSSSSHPTLMHSSVTIAQPQLQDQMQVVHQNINTESGQSVQMVLPEMPAQAQAVQSGNIPQSSSSHPTIMYPTMTMAQQPLQHIQVIQQPYFQQLYSPQQMFFPSNMTYQPTGAATTVQTIGPTQGLQLQTKMPVLDPKSSFNGQTFQVINQVTKAFGNQTLLPKPIYSSTLPLHPQSSNGSHLKQVTSQTQVFGSFSLPQGLTLATPGNFTTTSFLNPNSIIQNQQPEIILQSSPQTAMFVPVTAGTTPTANTIYTIVPQRKYSPRVRLKHSPATCTQTGIMTSKADTEKNKLPIPRFHVRPKGKVAIPYSPTVAQLAATTQATIETQTNQLQPQFQVAPQPNFVAANQIASNQMTNIIPQVEVPISKSYAPRTEAQNLAPISVPCNVQTTGSVIDRPVVSVAASTVTTTVSIAPVVTSVLQTPVSCTPVIPTVETLTPPSNTTTHLDNIHNLDSVVIKKEPVEYSADLNFENEFNKKQAVLKGTFENEPRELQMDPKNVKNDSVEHKTDSKIVNENEQIKHQTDSNTIVEKESIEHQAESIDVALESGEQQINSQKIEHETSEHQIDSIEAECETTNHQIDSIESECETTNHQIDSIEAGCETTNHQINSRGIECKLVEHETTSRRTDIESTEHQTDPKVINENELFKCQIDSKIEEPLVPELLTESKNDHLNSSVEKTRLKAIVRPHILTHVIDGFVIYESSEPFPVSRSALMSEPPHEMPKQDDKTKKLGQKNIDKQKKADHRKSVESKKADRRKSSELRKADFHDPKKVDKRERDEPKESNQRKSNEPKEIDQRKTDRPKELDQRKSDEPKKQDQKELELKMANPKIVDEPKKLDPKEICELKTADSNKPNELPVTPTEKLPKVPGKRGRKRKVVSNPSKAEVVQSPSIVTNQVNNSVQRIEVIDLEVEPIQEKKIIEDKNMSVPEAPSVERSVERTTVDSIKEVGSTETSFTQKLPTAWSVQDVYKFVKDIPSCADYAEEFRSQEIDGKALLLLKLDHIVTFTSMKFGPAIKLISLINNMKEKFSLEV